MKIANLGLKDLVPRVLMLEIEDCDFKEDGTVEEEVYHDDMFNRDLYFHTAGDGHTYLIDQKEGLVYHYGSYLMQNPLKDLLEYFEEKRVMLLYPMSEEDVREIKEEIFREEGEEDEEYKYKD